MNLQVTEAAIQQIRKSLEGRGRGIGIKIGVRTTGCSGLAYTLEFVDVAAEGDIEHRFDDISILINLKDAPYLEGLELDYARQGLNVGFDFKNPNEKNRCGCGESFTV